MNATHRGERSAALRVLVLQNGARHGYAVPAVLERAGMLVGFFTDAAGNVGVGRALSFARHITDIGQQLSRLAARRVPDEILPKTVAFTMAIACAKRIKTDLVGREMIREGFKGANMIYSSLGWGRALLRQARLAGIPTVVEFYVRPSIWRTYQAEFRAFPEWEAELPFAGLEGGVGTSRDPCLVADYVIVPAEGVAEDVVREHGFPAERIAVVPYAADERFFSIACSPTPGRVLFVGSCNLGKGIHYFAMAAAILCAKRPDNHFTFCAAGGVTDMIKNQPLCSHIQFLGRIPRNEVVREYAKADVFVLPTLSEGSAEVTYEALAAGLPVVTTPAAGSVVRDGIEGRIVAGRDPEALANAIEGIVCDRENRDRMSQAAKSRAGEFTWDRYGDRLVAALSQLR